jgi:hypothetical protein
MTREMDDEEYPAERAVSPRKQRMKECMYAGVEFAVDGTGECP